MTPQLQELDTLLKELKNNNKEIIRLTKEHDRLYSRIREICSNEGISFERVKNREDD